MLFCPITYFGWVISLGACRKGPGKIGVAVAIISVGVGTNVAGGEGGAGVFDGVGTSGVTGWVASVADGSTEFVGGGVTVTSTVFVLVDVGGGVDVLVFVGACVSVLVGVLVRVGVGVNVAINGVGVEVRVGVRVGVGCVSDGVGVNVLVRVGVSVSVTVGKAVCTGVTVISLDTVGVPVGIKGVIGTGGVSSSPHGNNSSPLAEDS